MTYRLYPDVQYSRRLFLHVILDEQDRPVWTGKRFEQALEWLNEQGSKQLIIDGERGTFALTFNVTKPGMPPAWE